MGAAQKTSEIFATELLAGQVALITGGGTGLGKATALELARCGAHVVISGRREEILRAAAQQIGERCSWIVADVREPDDAERLIKQIVCDHARLDLLINNAGGQYFVPAEGIATRGWDAVWRLNVQGIINMSEAAYELAMKPAGGGRILNVTLSPHHGMPGMAHSGAARAAVEALTKAQAEQWRPDRVTVVAIAAGHFDTDALDKYPPSVRVGAARTVPMQRLGRPQEHAWLMAMLASELGSAFNGSVVTLDGGRDNWFGPWPPPTLADDSGEVPTEERRTN
jgi:citronellol/citronellal dehydrogenase